MLSAAEAVSYSELSKVLPVPTVILAVVNTTLCTSLIAGRLVYVTEAYWSHLRAFADSLLLLLLPAVHFDHS